MFFKKKRIRDLLKIVGMNRKYQHVINQVTAVAVNYPAIRDVIEDIAGEKEGEFVEGIVDIYDKHFTGGDISKMIKFYQSKHGKKFIEMGPLLEEEMSNLATIYAKEIIKEAENKVYQALLNKKAEVGINPLDYILPLNFKNM